MSIDWSKVTIKDFLKLIPFILISILIAFTLKPTCINYYLSIQPTISLDESLNTSLLSKVINLEGSITEIKDNYFIFETRNGTIDVYYSELLNCKPKINTHKTISGAWNDVKNIDTIFNDTEDIFKDTLKFHVVWVIDGC